MTRLWHITPEDFFLGDSVVYFILELSLYRIDNKSWPPPKRGVPFCPLKGLGGTFSTRTWGIPSLSCVYLSSSLDPLAKTHDRHRLGHVHPERRYRSPHTDTENFGTTRTMTRENREDRCLSNNWSCDGRTMGPRTVTVLLSPVCVWTSYLLHP